MFAERMNRLGTETAFEVLAKARALEAQGKDDRPPRDRRARLRHAGQHPEGGGGRHLGGRHALRTVGRHDAGTRGRLSLLREGPRARVHAGPDRHDARRQADHLPSHPRARRPRRRGHLPEPRLSRSTSRRSTSPAARPCRCKYTEERDFRFDIAELEAKINPNTKMLIINSPQNPTGGVLEDSDLKRIAELAVENDVIVLSDEVYSKIIYEGEHRTIATLSGHEGAHHPHGRALQDLRDDRVEARLRRDADGDRREVHEAQHEHLLARDVVRADGRRRGARGSAGRGRRRWSASSRSGATPSSTV